MIYILYISYFATGGDFATENEIQTFPTEQACFKARDEVLNFQQVPTEAVCIKEGSNG